MDSLDTKEKSLFSVQSMVPRFLRALAKTAIACFSFMIFSMIASPVQGFGSLQLVFTVFFAVYTVFLFVIEITRDTVYQHVFSVARSLAAVIYFACLLNTSVISIPVEQLTLAVDLQFFFHVLLLGGILGLGKSILQSLNWINEKEEHRLDVHVKSP